MLWIFRNIVVIWISKFQNHLNFSVKFVICLPNVWKINGKRIFCVKCTCLSSVDSLLFSKRPKDCKTQGDHPLSQETQMTSNSIIENISIPPLQLRNPPNAFTPNLSLWDFKCDGCMHQYERMHFFSLAGFSLSKWVQHANTNDRSSGCMRLPFNGTTTLKTSNKKHVVDFDAVIVSFFFFVRFASFHCTFCPAFHYARTASMSLVSFERMLFLDYFNEIVRKRKRQRCESQCMCL